MSLDARLRAEIVRCVRRIMPSVRAIYAYGSAVRGDEHSRSDLDLALLLPPGFQPDGMTLLGLRAELETVAGRDVDLSVLDRARGVVHCKEVVVTGVPIDCADESSVREFEMRVLSDYARLCEDRRPVIASYTADAAR